MDHASGAIAPPDAEAAQVGDAIGQRESSLALRTPCGVKIPAGAGSRRVPAGPAAADDAVGVAAR